MVENYQKAAYYDGKKFHNYVEKQQDVNEKVYKKGIFSLLKWKFSKNNQIQKWPDWIENDSFPKPELRLGKENFSISFINHSTVLIQIAGLNILTDPVWSERVSPFNFIGPKRVRAAGISIDDLPLIDLILISHDHYDHLDMNTLKLLNKKFKPKIISGININKILGKHELNCTELDWWEKTNFNNVDIYFLPAKHWSGRKGFFGNNETLWGSFVIKSANKQVYFAGDTGYGEHIKMINKSFGKMDLSLIPIGAYLPRWFMKESHTNPYEAVLIHNELQSEHSVAIHHGTFRLSDEGYFDPVKDLEIAIEKLQIKKPFRILECGESWNIA